MSDLIRLSGTTVNAPDAIALARFYAGRASVLPVNVGAPRVGD